MLLKPKSIQSNAFALEPWTCHDTAELNDLVARIQHDAREGIQAKRAKVARFAVSNSAPEKKPSAPDVSISPDSIREQERERISILDGCLSTESNPLARKVFIAAKADGRGLSDCYGALLHIYGEENAQIESFRNLFNPQRAVIDALNDPNPHVRLFAQTYGEKLGPAKKTLEELRKEKNPGLTDPQPGETDGEDDEAELESFRQHGKKFLGLK